MRIFKFGGASVKDVSAVKNVKAIIDQQANTELFIVVSAMGKTTNALERIVVDLMQKNVEELEKNVGTLKEYHFQIIKELFENKEHIIYNELHTIFDTILTFKDKQITESYDFLYDQVVSLGEVISTKIIAAYLGLFRADILWKDARTFLRTDNTYRAARVDWEKTKELIQKTVRETKGIYLTQGFIGHTKEGLTTTLGREGSDFTAGIIAYCTNAESVTIWKDVPGMLNADPKWFENTVKLDKISYKEAIELAYYGASVIHPKTVQPLQQKNIPLYIKSFINPELSGSVIQASTAEDGKVSSFIFKRNQVLLSIIPKDFSFIVEENLSTIFKKLAVSGGHINLMQNSAVSFTVCLDINKVGLERLIALLQKEYEVRYNDEVELVTIRHYDNSTIERIMKNREMLMEQRTRQTVRIVMKREE